MPTRNTTDSSSSRRILSRLAILVVLIVVFTWPVTWLEDTEAQAVPSDPLSFAVVGDSRALRGVAPSYFDEKFRSLGIPHAHSLNFAQSGTDVLHHRRVVVEQLLRAEHPPKVIVWAVQPLEFDGTETNNRLDRLSLGDVEPLARAGAPRELLLDVSTVGAFPAYRHRGPAKEWMETISEQMGKKLGPLQSLLGLHYERAPKMRKYISHDDGHQSFLVLADWNRQFNETLGHYRAKYEKLQISPWHFTVARELAAKAREQKSLLVILELPVAPAYRRELGISPKHTSWRNQIAQLAKEEHALFLSHFDHFGDVDDDKRFGDPGHMDDAAANDYSEFLANELAEQPRIREALDCDRLRRAQNDGVRVAF